MRYNKLRGLLRDGKTSLSTRMWSTNPIFTENLGVSGNFDYMEFVAEYVPFSQMDLENMARAAELYEMGTMIKIDFQNRFYVAQKALASGFQAINFADCRTPEDVRESINAVRPYTEGSDGLYGCPNRRFIGRPSGASQLEHIERLNDVVLCFMIEKRESVDRIDEICEIRGVDMVQFGPSDYCMSCGWNRSEHTEDYKQAERKVIAAALRHGVQPRCEINLPEEAQYYIDLGVRHFSLGDQMVKLRELWNVQGKQMRDISKSLEK